MSRRPTVPPDRGTLVPPAGLHLLCHAIGEPVAVVAVPSGAVLERNAAFHRLFGDPERLADLSPRLRRAATEKPRRYPRMRLAGRRGIPVDGAVRIVPIPTVQPPQAFFHVAPRGAALPSPAEAQRLERLLEEGLARIQNFERLRSLGELAAILVHEIRTPLTTIRMLVDAVRRADLDALHRKRLDGAVEQVERIDRQLSRIRDYARPFRLEAAAVDAREIVASALSALQGVLGRPGLALELEPDSGPTTVWADRERMTEALTNVVLNAAEALEKGGRITVGVAPARRRGWTEIRVWDDGPGIPADALPRVFQPFFTTKRTGSGLGLALVKKILDLHGGFVHLRSAPGKGTLVTLELPPPKK